MASEWVKSVSSLDDGDAEKLMAKLNLGCSKVTAHGKNERKRLEEGFKICETVRAEAQRNVTKFLDSSSFIYHFDQTCLVVLSIISGSLGYKKKAAEFSKELKERDDKAGRADSGDFLLTDQAVDVPPHIYPHQDDVRPDQTREQRALQHLHGRVRPVSQECRKRLCECIAGGRVFRRLVRGIKTGGCDVSRFVFQHPLMLTTHSHVTQHAEAIKWMTETYTRSKRVYGPRHPDTMRSRKKFLMLSGFVDLPRRATLANAGAGGVKQEVTILKPTKGGKYIASIGSGRKVKVTPRQIILEVDTPVVHPEGFTCFVDGLDSRKDCYKVLAFSGIDEHDEEVFLDVPRDVRVFFAPC